MNPLKSLSRLFRAVAGFTRAKTRRAGSMDELQGIIKYRFRSLDLLAQALTHKSSVCSEDPKGLLSNERLEFLGDSVLNCLVTEHLYLEHLDKSEGQLSKIKSLIVSRKILGEIAFAFNLGDFLILGVSEEKSGGRKRLSTLSNTFESLLGAIFLDGGLPPCKDFLDRFLFGRINEFLKDERNTNYKSKILEMSQRDGFGIPHYITVSTTGPDHAKEFKVRIDIAGVALGEGLGTNKKIAQQNAAQIATVNYNKEIIQSRIKGEGNDELFSQ